MKIWFRTHQHNSDFEIYPTEDCFMKRTASRTLTWHRTLGYMAGYASNLLRNPFSEAHFDDLSMLPSANAQDNKNEVMPPSVSILPKEPPSRARCSARHVLRNRRHSQSTHRYGRESRQNGQRSRSGSSQSFGGGPVHVQTRNSACLWLYACIATSRSSALTKVDSVFDGRRAARRCLDFYIFTGGTGEMILGGKNRQPPEP